MKRPRITVRQGMLLLLVLLLVNPQPAKAQAGGSGPSPLWVGLMTPDISSIQCIGKKLDIEFYFSYLYFTRPGELPPPVPLVRNVDVNISANNKKGTVFPKYIRYPPIDVSSVYEGTFSYMPKTEGKEQIDIKVKMGHYETTLSIGFMVKPCSAFIQFNQSNPISDGVITLVNNYSGNGFLYMDENGQISGSGVQSIWGDILPYFIDGATCTHTPPWEGSSRIKFTGQMEKNGEINVFMELEPLSVAASVLTCTGEGSGGMSFPAYTYSACRVPLKGFNFEATTLNVQFDCVGEESYTMPITIIPKEKP